MSQGLVPDRVVVVGASAGGVPALTALVAALGRGFGLPVVVVLHLSPDSPSVLPEILERADGLTASAVEDGEPLRPGHLHVAPPDRHVLVTTDGLRLSQAPREHLHRPSIDATFRSAAESFGPGAIGVILSGALDDGARGLDLIKQRGGMALVQDPEEAAVSSMPLAACARVDVDRVAGVAELARVLRDLPVAGGNAGVSSGALPGTRIV